MVLEMEPTVEVEVVLAIFSLVGVDGVGLSVLGVSGRYKWMEGRKRRGREGSFYDVEKKAKDVIRRSKSDVLPVSCVTSFAQIHGALSAQKKPTNSV